MAFLQESPAPDDGQRQVATTPTTPTTTTDEPRNGVDWNGPMGFWIALLGVVAIVIALGLLLQ